MRAAPLLAAGALLIGCATTTAWDGAAAVSSWARAPGQPSPREAPGPVAHRCILALRGAFQHPSSCRCRMARERHGGAVAARPGPRALVRLAMLPPGATRGPLA
jgi:hypothetical protein